MRNNEQLFSKHISLKIIAKLFIPAMFLIGSEAWAVTYTVIDLATLAQGTTTVVRGPNAAGNAVGGGTPVSQGGMVNERRGLLFANGAVRQINGLPGTDYTTVFGINDVGRVVGGSNTATAVRAFINTPAEGTRELPPLAGDIASTAFAVNNLGQAVGFSSGPGGEHAVIWAANRTVTALPGASGVTTRALAINERSDVVGVVDSGTGRRAVLWPRAGSLQELAMLPGNTTSEAAGVNASGTVVGYSADSTNARRATLWASSGGPINLGTLPGGDFSQAFGINDSGDVVGASTSNSGDRAFVWTSAAGMQDLNTLIPSSSVVLTKAVGINNVGMIIVTGHDVGHGTDAGHEDHESPVRVFLLTPSGARP
jgi:probable HAF family extracellular repeat protein